MRLSAVTDDDGVLISVDDDGPGLCIDLLEDVFTLGSATTVTSPDADPSPETHPAAPAIRCGTAAGERR
ncbi:hypothetical protein [Pseudokineococcus marinus]|uniref:Histidine kinase-, DNA gyrase B-, and HSP90-like ATPase n=1 Tax=Pseudokineococcus marinus TaxID=351215 RepID=A0A849BLM4_9ACTN|nr:hypothetical protein [Pseudokineococcus marinus]NNH21702.1 hypothetical protein [Pseudokineococcus marinus]